MPGQNIPPIIALHPLDPAVAAVGAGILDLYDRTGKLLSCVPLQGECDWFPDEVACLIPRIIALPCHFLLLRRQGRQGCGQPAPGDVGATRALALLLRIFDIRLHDHLLLGRGHCFSFRAEGLL